MTFAKKKKSYLIDFVGAVSAAPKDETVSGCKTEQRPFSDARRRQRCLECWMGFQRRFLVCVCLRLTASEEWLIITTVLQSNAASRRHLPSLTSPWSLTRILAPWRWERAEPTSTMRKHNSTSRGRIHFVASMSISQMRKQLRKPSVYLDVSVNFLLPVQVVQTLNAHTHTHRHRRRHTHIKLHFRKSITEGRTQFIKCLHWN